MFLAYKIVQPMRRKNQGSRFCPARSLHVQVNAPKTREERANNAEGKNSMVSCFARVHLNAGGTRRAVRAPVVPEFFMWPPKLDFPPKLAPIMPKLFHSCSNFTPLLLGQ